MAAANMELFIPQKGNMNVLMYCSIVALLFFKKGSSYQGLTNQYRRISNNNMFYCLCVYFTKRMFL